MSVHTKILVPLCIDTWVHAGGGDGGAERL